MKGTLDMYLGLYNNPTAKRILGYDNRMAEISPGKYGNVYLGSYDNLVVP